MHKYARLNLLQAGVAAFFLFGGICTSLAADAQNEQVNTPGVSSEGINRVWHFP